MKQFHDEKVNNLPSPIPGLVSVQSINRTYDPEITFNRVNKKSQDLSHAGLQSVDCPTATTYTRWVFYFWPVSNGSKSWAPGDQRFNSFIFHQTLPPPACNAGTDMSLRRERVHESLNSTGRIPSHYHCFSPKLNTCEVNLPMCV